MAGVPWPLLPYSSLLLPLPRLGLVVVLPDAVVELAGEAADDGLVAGVGEPEAAAGEAAEVLVGPDDDDGLAHPLRLHRGGDGGGGAAVDDDVGLARGGGERQGGEKVTSDGKVMYTLLYMRR